MDEKIELKLNRDDLVSKIKKIINEELSEYKDKPIWVIVEIIGKGTGVKGDIGLYGHIIVINIKSEEDAKLVELSWSILRKIQSRISSIQEVSRVLYDLT